MNVNVAWLVERGGPHRERNAVARRISEAGHILLEAAPRAVGSPRAMVLVPVQP